MGKIAPNILFHDKGMGIIMITFEKLWNNGIFGILAENSGGPFLWVLGIILSAVIAYLLGSLNFCVIISNLSYRDDVRSHGSGNGGMTNMLRTYGKGAAAVTLLCDAAKAALSILVVGRMLGGVWGANIAGLACIIGHVYPIYFGFRGGKGVVTVAVMILCQNPFVFLILFAVFVVAVASTKYVSLGSCLCMVIYPYVLYNMTGYGSHIIIAVISAAFVLFLHRENIKRLHEGKENKISFSKKKKNKGKNENGAKAVESRESVSASDGDSKKKKIMDSDSGISENADTVKDKNSETDADDKKSIER